MNTSPTRKTKPLDLTTWSKEDLKANGYIRSLPTGYVWTKTGEPYVEVQRAAADDTEGGAV